MPDCYTQDIDSGEKFYFETQSYKPIVMKDTQEISIQEVCTEILWMNPPFVTYRFPEWATHFETRNLESISDSRFAPRWVFK